MHKRRIAFSALTFLVIVTMAPAPLSASPTDDPFGFAANYAVDVQAYADAVGVSFDTALARMTARERIDATLATISSDPDTYAGAYFTQNINNYVLHVVLKQGRTLTVALPPSSRALTIVTQTSTHSATDFNMLRDEVRRSGIAFSEMSVDLAHDRLDVTVPETSAASAMRGVVGPDTNITVGPMPEFASCVDRYHCTYRRGGTFLIDTQLYVPGQHPEACSLGFIARGNGSGYLQLLTAAHCDTNDQALTHWYSDTYGNPYEVGNEVGDTCPSCTNHLIGGNYDMEKAKLVDQGNSVNNRVYFNNNLKNYAITSVKDYTQVYNGDWVNMTGYVSGTHGAVEVVSNWTEWRILDGNGDIVTIIGGKTHTATNPLVGGDSGGPVYFSGAAIGLNNSSKVVGNDSWGYFVYAKINADGLNVTICTTDAC